VSSHFGAWRFDPWKRVGAIKNITTPHRRVYAKIDIKINKKIQHRIEDCMQKYISKSIKIFTRPHGRLYAKIHIKINQNYLQHHIEDCMQKYISKLIKNIYNTT